MLRLWSELWSTVPIVIKTYLLLFWTLLILTIVIWLVDNFVPHSGGAPEEHHIFPVFENTLTVAFGAVIGALSQWAHHEPGSRAS